MQMKEGVLSTRRGGVSWTHGVKLTNATLNLDGILAFRGVLLACRGLRKVRLGPAASSASLCSLEYSISLLFAKLVNRFSLCTPLDWPGTDVCFAFYRANW